MVRVGATRVLGTALAYLKVLKGKLIPLQARCLNVTQKTPYKKYEGKTKDVLIAFTGYINDLNKLQQFKVSVQKSHHRLQCTFQPSWQQFV